MTIYELIFFNDAVIWIFYSFDLKHLTQGYNYIYDQPKCPPQTNGQYLLTL